MVYELALYNHSSLRGSVISRQGCPSLSVTFLLDKQEKGNPGPGVEPLGLNG
jgi:hypothetical protein